MHKVNRKTRMCWACLTPEEQQCQRCRNGRVPGYGDRWVSSRRRLCRLCLYDEQRQYELRGAFVADINIHRVEPPTVRMHHVIHCEALHTWRQPGPSPATTPLTSWTQLFQLAGDRADAHLRSSLRREGRVVRGLSYGVDGHGFSALVLTSLDRLLLIRGSW